MKTMRKTLLAIFGLAPCILLQPAGTRSAAQEDAKHLRMKVVLVQLSIAVTDGKGNYINGLHPEDFEVTEDKIPQKISSFEEGSGTGNDADPNGNDHPDLMMPPACSRDSQPVDSHLQTASTTLLEPHGNQASVFVNAELSSPLD